MVSSFSNSNKGFFILFFFCLFLFFGNSSVTGFISSSSRRIPKRFVSSSNILLGGNNSVRNIIMKAVTTSTTTTTNNNKKKNSSSLLRPQRLKQSNAAATTIRLNTVTRKFEKITATPKKDNEEEDDTTITSTIKKKLIEKKEEEVPKSMGMALRRFFLGKDLGPISVVFILLGVVLNRFWFLSSSISSFGRNDVIAVLSSIVFWWIQEHILHDKVLHSDVDWFGKDIHAEHHSKPYYHISIDPAELMLGWMLSVHLLLRCILPLHLALSATFGYSLAGLGYEWSHYIVHTKVRPKAKLFQAIRQNHMKHHLVDNRYWFAFSIPAMDDIFGTNPGIDNKQKREKKKILNNN